MLFIQHYRIIVMNPQLFLMLSPQALFYILKVLRKMTVDLFCWMQLKQKHFKSKYQTIHQLFHQYILYWSSFIGNILVLFVFFPLINKVKVVYFKERRQCKLYFFRGMLKKMLAHLFWFCLYTKLWIKSSRFIADHIFPQFRLLWVWQEFLLSVLCHYLLFWPEFIFINQNVQAGKPNFELISWMYKQKSC